MVTLKNRVLWVLLKIIWGAEIALRIYLLVARLLKKAGAKIMFAIIESGGKQYKVQQGDVVFVEKLAADEGASVEFKTIAILDNGKVATGNPVDSAKVVGTVLKNGKGKKITVFTYKPKKSEKRKLGHRQPYTKVQIESINA